MIYLFLTSVLVNIILVAYIGFITTAHKKKKAHVIKVRFGDDWDESSIYNQ